MNFFCYCTVKVKLALLVTLLALSVPVRVRAYVPFAATEFVTVTFVVPDFVESCVEVALIVAEPEAGAADAAVYAPALVSVPESADQVTAELKLPVPATVAEH